MNLRNVKLKNLISDREKMDRMLTRNGSEARLVIVRSQRWRNDVRTEKLIKNQKLRMDFWDPTA